MFAASLRVARVPSGSVLGRTVQQRSFTLSALHQKSFTDLVQEIKSTNKQIHYISSKDLRAIASNVSAETPRLPPHVIDVREQHEIESTGTIPGAIVLPRGVLERDVSKFLKQSDPRDLVVYCAGGMRSVLAAESLVRLGYGNIDSDVSKVTENKNRPRVWSLNEGFDGWAKSGYEVDKKKQS